MRLQLLSGCASWEEAGDRFGRCRYQTDVARLKLTYPGLLYCFASGSLGVFELAPAAAFLAQVASVQQFVLDLFHCQTATSCVFCPGHIGPVKIATIRRGRMEFFQRSDAPPPPWPPLLGGFTLSCTLIRTCSDTGEKFGRLGINSPLCGAQACKRPHSGWQSPLGLWIGKSRESAEVSPVSTR